MLDVFDFVENKYNWKEWTGFSWSLHSAGYMTAGVKQQEMQFRLQTFTTVRRF